MTTTPAELLSRRSLVAVVPYAPSGDLRVPPTGVVLAALDETAHLLLDGDGRALLAAWTKRSDRVFAFDEARPALRRLLAADVDVARPVCRITLERLAGARLDDSGRLPASVDTARGRATDVVHKLEALLERVDAAGHKKVARLECLVLRAFAALEHRGLPIDFAGWRALVDEEKAAASAAKKHVVEVGGQHIVRDLFGEPEINLESESEVRALVEKVAGLALDDTSRFTLGKLQHPIGQALLRFRESQKIVGTYGDSFLARVDDAAGVDPRVRASFIPLGASTGRTASRDPNLQNLPADERFHRCLRAPPGRMLVTADYATAELRIVAELAKDPVFLAAFQRGEDLHATVASSMFGVTVSKTERPELRQRAKGINFGLVYGMGGAGLAASLGVSRDQADELLARYFQTFPRIRDYLERSVDQALAKGYAETLLGRRLAFDPETLRAPNARGELSRIAKNMPIQGTSADMTKLAMVRVHERLLEEHPTAGLVNTIHDELLVECDEGEAQAVAVAVREEMEGAHQALLKDVPPLVEVAVERHWAH